MRKQLQFPPQSNWHVVKVTGRSFQKTIGRHARFPIGIAIVLFDEHFHGWKCVMIDLAAQSSGWSIHDHVLMNFIVAAVRRRISQLLVSA